MLISNTLVPGVAVIIALTGSVTAAPTHPGLIPTPSSPSMPGQHTKEPGWPAHGYHSHTRDSSTTPHPTIETTQVKPSELSTDKPFSGTWKVLNEAATYPTTTVVETITRANDHGHTITATITRIPGIGGLLPPIPTAPPFKGPPKPCPIDPLFGNPGPVMPGGCIPRNTTATFSTLKEHHKRQGDPLSMWISDPSTSTPLPWLNTLTSTSLVLQNNTSILPTPRVTATDTVILTSPHTGPPMDAPHARLHIPGHNRWNNSVWTHGDPAFTSGAHLTGRPRVSQHLGGTHSHDHQSAITRMPLPFQTEAVARGA